MIEKQKIVIIGAGGYGLEVYHMLDKKYYECIGFLDLDTIQPNLPVPIIGHESNIEFLKDKFRFTHYALAIGNSAKRKEIVNLIDNKSLTPLVLIDSSTRCFSSNIGNGTIIYPGVVIMNGCSIGSFSLINSGVTLGHDVIIGNYCNINPGAHLAGRITIEDEVFIGIGAIIKENVKIGKKAIVGAGSVVIKDVPENSIVYGIPAKPRNSQ